MGGAEDRDLAQYATLDTLIVTYDAPRVVEPSLYVLTVRLNDHSPIFVRPPFTAVQPRSLGYTDRSPG